MTTEQSSSSLSVERGKEAEVVEVGEEEEVEDISDERYAKMHSKGERLKKKINRKQEQSASWQLRNNREMRKKKVAQQNPGGMFLNSSLAHVINTRASTCTIHTC